jgi:phosphate-selective porin
LTARFATLDFIDPDTPAGPSGQLVGISVPTATFGVNWYLTDRLRLLFNYTYEVPDEPNTGTSTGNVYALRLNVFW